MSDSKTGITGKTGEDIACLFLQKKGYRVIERNFWKPWGEIDIIAEFAGQVRFVEVKAGTAHNGKLSREINSYRPEDMIHAHKLRKIARTATLYMEMHRDRREYQIDAVGVILDPISRRARCTLYEQIL